MNNHQPPTTNHQPPTTKHQTILVCLILALFTSVMSAQDDICGTDMTTVQGFSNSSNSNIYSFSTNPTFLATFPQRNINIAIWGIEKTDGTRSISQTEVFDIIEALTIETAGQYIANLITDNVIIDNKQLIKN